jgi:hypothetical protein
MMNIDTMEVWWNWRWRKELESTTIRKSHALCHKRNEMQHMYVENNMGNIK